MRSNYKLINPWLGKSQLVKKIFEKLLLEAVDSGLDSLGDSAKQAIYFHLENKFEIARKDIPQRVEEFADGLERIFGVGAQSLEILIMKELHERIGQRLKWNKNKELLFAEYIAAARSSFLRQGRRS